MALISLAPDDLPTCPQHGIRIVTDFIMDEDGTEYEMGTCPLCKRVYKFVVEDEEGV